MTNFEITVVNHEFTAVSEQELEDSDAAMAQALKGALAVGTEAVVAGNDFFGAEVIVSDGNFRERFMVAIGVSPLK